MALKQAERTKASGRHLKNIVNSNIASVQINCNIFSQTLCRARRRGSKLYKFSTQLSRGALSVVRVPKLYITLNISGKLIFIVPTCVSCELNLRINAENFRVFPISRERNSARTYVVFYFAEPKHTWHLYIIGKLCIWV